MQAQGRFLIKQCLNAIPSLPPPHSSECSGISGLLPSALLITSRCSGGQGSREGRRRTEPLLLPAAYARSPAESQTAGGEGPVCFSNGSKAFV